MTNVHKDPEIYGRSPGKIRMFSLIILLKRHRKVLLIPVMPFIDHHRENLSVKGLAKI